MTVPAGITRLLQDYFDMLYHCDLERFDAVFHEQAIYATADEALPLVRNMRDYREVIAHREPPALRHESRHDFIDDIHVAGENTARARVRSSIGTRDFVDFLTLIRTDGQWRIIAKVFQIMERG